MCAEQEEREKEEEEEYINIIMMIKDESVIDGRLMSERVNGRSERVNRCQKKSLKPVRIEVDSQVCLWRIDKIDKFRVKSCPEFKRG